MAHKNKTNISPYKTRRKALPAAGKASSPLKTGPAISRNSSNSSAATASSSPSTAVAGPQTSFPKVHPGARKQGRTTPVGGSENARGQHRRAQVIYELEEANDRLFDLFRNHGFKDFPHAQRRELAQYYRLLMLKQNQVNMTRLLTLREVGLKHFVDCLMVAKLTDLKFPLLDLGTGPGLPGIPLKIQFPNEQIILAEGVQKRVEFLKEVRDSLQLRNLKIVGRNINQWFYYPVNGVITRAVEDVGNTLRNVRSALQTGGRVYFMKGPNVDPEIAVALSELGEYYKLVSDIPYELPESGLPRRLVIFEKIKAFPWQDPELEPWPGENNRGEFNAELDAEVSTDPNPEDGNLL